MITWHVKEGHLELVDEAVEFLPFRRELHFGFLAPFDEIADRQDERSRLEQIQLLDRPAKRPRGRWPAGAIADDGELKLGGIVIVAQMGDRIAFVPGKEGLAASAAADTGKDNRGTDADERDACEPKPFHVNAPIRDADIVSGADGYTTRWI